MPNQQPDYDRLTSLPALLKVVQTDDSAPITKRLHAEMQPYEDAVKAGQLTVDDFNKIAARTMLNYMGEYMGGNIPDQKDAEAFATQRRMQALPPGSTLDPKEPGFFAEPYNVIGALQKQAGPETAPVPSDTPPPPAPAPAPNYDLSPVEYNKPPQPSQPLPAGPTAPGGSLDLSSLINSLSPSDENKLSAAMLQLLPALVAPSRSKPDPTTGSR